MRKICILGIWLCILASLNANPINPGTIYGDKYQGDIMLTPEQEESNRSGKTGVKDTYYRWPKINGYVTIPYVIDGYTASERNVIFDGMNRIAAKTCVRFVQRTNQADYIRIFSGDGCWSFVGRIRGKQDLSLLRNGCVSAGTVVHELGHAIGFKHMHQHWDRGTKIRINYENISPANRQYFDIIDRNKFDNFGTPYDISSIMHYDSRAFSSNGGKTMQAYNSDDQRIMDQNKSDLSAGDARRIRNMYQC